MNRRTTVSVQSQLNDDPIFRKLKQYEGHITQKIVNKMVGIIKGRRTALQKKGIHVDPNNFNCVKRNKIEIVAGIEKLAVTTRPPYFRAMNRFSKALDYGPLYDQNILTSRAAMNKQYRSPELTENKARQFYNLGKAKRIYQAALIDPYRHDHALTLAFAVDQRPLRPVELAPLKKTSSTKPETLPKDFNYIHQDVAFPLFLNRYKGSDRSEVPKTVNIRSSQTQKNIKKLIYGKADGDLIFGSSKPAIMTKRLRKALNDPNVTFQVMRTIVGTDEVNQLKHNDPNVGKQISDIAESMLHSEITCIEKYSKSDSAHRKKLSQIATQQMKNRGII